MENNKKYTGFTSTQIGDPDPETGKVTFDVKYNADFNLIRKKFNELKSEYYNDFLKHKDVRDDKKFIEIGKGIDYLNNQYNNHIVKYYKRVKLDKLDENKIRSIIRKALDEESATGAGASAGTFTPGDGAQTAEPIKTSYHYKLKDGYKLVNTKKLEETEKSPALENFINTRITDFDKIEEKINALRPLLEKAKAETMEYYKTSPNFQIKYGTDLASDYLDDLITLFKDKQ
jgi:hypothetical protein